MYFIYLDEAGNTGRKLDDPEQPYHIMVALLVEEGKWKEVELDFGENIIEKYIPERDRSGFEFHAVDVFQGKKYFKGWKREVRNEIINSILELPVKHELKIIYACVDKSSSVLAEYKDKNRYKPSVHPHDFAFLLVSEMVEKFFKGEAPDSLGMFISDENQADIETKMKRSLMVYRHMMLPFGLPGSRLEHIIETIHFVSSQESEFIQIADFCAYFINRFHKDKKDAKIYYDKIKPLVYTYAKLRPDRGVEYY